MDEDHIRLLIETLEESTKSSDGKSRLVTCSPRNILFLTANRTGLLKLACALLRTAQEPILTDDCRSKPVEVDNGLNQVCEDESNRVIGFIQRMETWPEPVDIIKKRKLKAWQRDRIALLGCSVIGLILFLIFTAGLTAIWKVFD